MNEKEIENLILEWLNHSGKGFFWKNQSTGVYDPSKKVFRKSYNKYHIKGVSDILGVSKSGKFIAIEVKTPKTKNAKSKSRKNQDFFLSIVNDMGGFGMIAWNLDMVIDASEHF